MSEETSRTSWVRVTFDFLITSIFLALIGGLFVVFCVLLGKKELLVLAYVLLSAVFLRSLLSEQWQYLLERIVIIGEGLRIFRILEEHYIQYEPRTMWFYLFFPITSVWGFVVDRERGRKELKSYWRLLQWVLFMLIIGGFTSYYRLYRYFSWQTSLAWLYTELLAIYFLCNFFAVPFSTTSIRLSIQQKKRRLFFLTCLSLAILTGSIYVFSIRSNLTRLIPMNLVLDLRLAQLKELKTSPRKQEDELLLTHNSSRYFDEIQQKTKMFFQFYGPRVIAFHQKHFFDRDEQLKTRFYKGLNRAYQEFLASTSMLHENKHIYLTLTQTPSAFWGAVCFPFRESIFYLFRYESKKPFGKRFTLYKKLKDLPSTLRREISGMWDTDGYRFSTKKRLAQVIVEFMRDKYRRTGRWMWSPSVKKHNFAPTKSKSPTHLSSKRSGAPYLRGGGGMRTGLGRATGGMGTGFGRGSGGMGTGFRGVESKQDKLLKKAKKLQKTIEELAETSVRVAGQLNAFLKGTFGLHVEVDLDNNELVALHKAWPKQWSTLDKKDISTSLAKMRTLRKRAMTQVEFALASLLPKETNSPASQPTTRSFSSTPAVRRLARLKTFSHSLRQTITALKRRNTWLVGLHKRLHQSYRERLKRRRLFFAYTDALFSFDYPRALAQGLLYEHFGRQFAFVQTWWTFLYNGFLTIIVLLFQLCMPLHIGLIFYCQWILQGEDEDDDEFDVSKINKVGRSGFSALFGDGG